MNFSHWPLNGFYIDYFTPYARKAGKVYLPDVSRIELTKKISNLFLIIVLKNARNVEQIIFNHDFFLSVFLDSDNHDNL